MFMPLVIEVAVVVTLNRKQHNNIFFILDAQRLLLLQYGSDAIHPAYRGATE